MQSSILHVMFLFVGCGDFLGAVCAHLDDFEAQLKPA